MRRLLAGCRPCRIGASSNACLPSASVEKLALAGDVAAVTFGRHVLAHGLDRFAGDDLSADGGLHRNYEQMARDQVLELLAHGASAQFGAGAVHNHGKRIDRFAVHEN